MENSLFSDTEIDDKQEKKIENEKKFEKRKKIWKIWKKRIAGNMGQKFGNEKVFLKMKNLKKRIKKC